MAQAKNYLWILLITLLLCEGVSRYFVSRTFQKPFWRSDLAVKFFYPELFSLPDKLDAGQINVLVLGGSAITDTLCHTSSRLEREIKSAGWNVKVFNLAQYAHNTLDSRIKFKYCKALGFDYVFVYNGINDNRANNCPEDIFRPDYSHIGFYSEVDILERHLEIKYFTLPFVLDYCWNELKIKTGWKKTIPKEYLIANWKLIAPDTIQAGNSNENERAIKAFIASHQDLLMGIGSEQVTVDSVWWEDGSSIKSVASFRNNLEYIYDQKPPKTKLILTDYAWYQPKNYSLQKFLYGKLDYGEQRWPTEIYGKPENVIKGLIKHDAIIDSIANIHHEIIYFNFNDSIPHSGTFFNDICHLADSGQALLCHILAQHIINDLTKKKSQN